MELSLLEPRAIAFLLVPLVVLVVGLGRPGARHHATLRSTILALLALALCRPIWFSADHREHRILIVDESASSAGDGTASRFIEDIVAAADDAHPTAIVTLDDGDTESAVDRRGVATSHLRGDRSPVSSALAAAAHAIPDRGRGSITLITDGLATDRRYGDIVPELVERGLPVHVVRRARNAHDPVVAAFEPLDTLRVGSSGRLAIEIVGRGVVDGAAIEVEVVEPGGESIGRVVAVARDGLARAELEWEPKQDGFVVLEARLVDGASVLRRTVAIDPPHRALYLGERVKDGGPTFSELVGPGFTFTPHDPSQPLPDLAAFDLAIVDDVPAASLGDANLRALERAVEDDGIGLFACGGGSAFTAGGWYGTPLADLLPVRCTQKEEKRDPSTTLVVIIDTSGSMAGERVQLAKEVARLAMMRLLPHDKVGIVEFFGGKRWAAPIQSASNSIDLARAINRLDAGGGTVILPAIEEAWYGLQNVQTRYKHVLVLTDGGVESGAFEPLLRRMAEDGINVSTVLIGAETHSEFLVDLANWGKGRFYAVPDRFNLPEILLKQPSTSRLPAYEPVAVRVRTKSGPAWLGDLDPAALASIGGYVETEAKDGSQVVLELETSRTPLLATWQYGVGRVTAFTSEPCGPGTAPWRANESAGALFARVLERTASTASPPLELAIERRGEICTLIAKRNRGGAMPEAEFEILRSDGEPVREQARFEERSDRHFVARLRVSPDAEVRVTATSLAGTVRRVSNPRADERPELGVADDLALDLSALARVTGGIELAGDDSAGMPAAGGSGDRLRQHALAPWFALAALVFWLFEIFHRRRDRVVVSAPIGARR